MNSTKPVFSDDQRKELNLLDRFFEAIKHRKQIFLHTLFPENNERQTDFHPAAILVKAQDCEIITFHGYGKTLQAQPEYFIHEDKWRLRYLFHIIHTHLDGKKKTTPLYQIEICDSGMVYMGGDEPVSLSGDWHQEAFVYNRLKQNLLCALVQYAK